MPLLKRSYWVLYEHYLHLFKHERLKDWLKSEISQMMAITCLERPFFSSSSVLTVKSLSGSRKMSIIFVGENINVGQSCNAQCRASLSVILHTEFQDVHPMVQHINIPDTMIVHVHLSVHAQKHLANLQYTSQSTRRGLPYPGPEYRMQT